MGNPKQKHLLEMASKQLIRSCLFDTYWKLPGLKISQSRASHSINWTAQAQWNHTPDCKPHLNQPDWSAPHLQPISAKDQICNAYTIKLIFDCTHKLLGLSDPKKNTKNPQPKKKEPKWKPVNWWVGASFFPLREKEHMVCSCHADGQSFRLNFFLLSF